MRDAVLRQADIHGQTLQTEQQRDEGKIWALLTNLSVKNPPARQETWVQSLGREDPLEEGMATHSSILAWRTCKDRGAWRATVHGVSESWT